jgi:hypothetical protein
LHEDIQHIITPDLRVDLEEVDPLVHDVVEPHGRDLSTARARPAS